jgi:DNA primase
MFNSPKNIYNSLKDYCLSLGIPLIQQGKYYRAHCPLPTHRGDDKVPSFTVYPNDTFYCFGCLEGGDGDRLAYLLGKEGPRILRKYQRDIDINARKPATIQQIELMTRFYETYNELTPVAREYLEKRGFKNPDALKIGYCSGRKSWVRTEERKLAYLLGLINSQGWDKLAGKLLIPEIRDGQIIWLQGRALDNSEPKYYNVHIEKPLYGLESAKNQNFTWVVEGVFDALSLHEAGQPAVAIIGSYLQDHQIPNFGGIMAINICFDNDEAGQKATKRIIEQLKNIIPFIHKRNLPQGMKDVNELYAAGRIKEIL